jgi:hypothetical protein
MAEQAGERRVTVDVGAELISLMVPNVDLELVQLMLGRAARSAAGGRADNEGDRGGAGKPQTSLLQEYAELLALIRDARIDRTQLCTILGLDPEALPTGDDNPHLPVRENESDSGPGTGPGSNVLPGVISPGASCDVVAEPRDAV